MPGVPGMRVVCAWEGVHILALNCSAAGSRVARCWHSFPQEKEEVSKRVCQEYESDGQLISSQKHFRASS